MDSVRQGAEIGEARSAPFPAPFAPLRNSEVDTTSLVAKVLVKYLLICCCILTLYGIVAIVHNQDALPYFNGSLPLVLLCSSLWASFRLIRIRTSLIWTPVPWFLAVAGLYYGFGPLIYYFGSDAGIALSQTFYFVTDWGILRANVLNVVGMSIVVISFLAYSAIWRLPKQIANPELNVRAARNTVILFLTIGLPIKYFLALPFAFGFFDFILSGSVQQLELFTSFAVVILVLLVAKGHTQYKPALYILVASEIFVGLLTFSKQQVLITVIMIVFGLCIHEFKIKRVVGGGIIAAILYVIITPLIPYGRTEISRQSGSHYNAGLADRLKIFSQYLLGDRRFSSESDEDSQMWWCRLNYTPSQMFAYEAFDAGDPGDSLSLLIPSLIPRFLWREKTVISNIGVQFNERITGNPNSQSSPGVIAEGYWNGGWPLYAFIPAVIGILFGWLTRFCVSMMEALRLGFLPCIFIAIKMGFRLDGWFIIEYTGALATFVGMYLLTRIFYVAQNNTPSHLATPAG
jgi:hypothetical protein